MIKKLPETAGKLEEWKQPSKAFNSSEGSGIYASPSNAHFPLPQTHRFYLPRAWSAERQDAGGFVLKGSVPARPDVKIAKTAFGTDEFLYNQVERAEWIELTPVAARLYQTEAGKPDRDLGTATLTPDGMQIELATIPEGLRVEVEYALPDRAQTIVQSLSLGTDGKRNASSDVVELR